jgi:serine O-acetyltransferase
VVPNGDDPLSKALHGLIDHAATQEHQIECITAALKAAGIGCENLLQNDKFDPDQLNKLVG